MIFDTLTISGLVVIAIISVLLYLKRKKVKNNCGCE